MIVIVDYKAGNLTSVERALSHLGAPSRISADPEEIRRADRIIVPGVGHAGTAMATLREHGLDQVLEEALHRGTPMLGICLGAQIILSRSEEGATDCLGFLPGRARRFSLRDPMLKIPHMGWNVVDVVRPHPLLCEVRPGDEFYFVHSYYPDPDAKESVFATTEYETQFASAIGKGSLFATQFHLEKSGRIGLQILRQFTTWDGTC